MALLRWKENPAEKAARYGDRPLNLESDQVPDINPQLRHLDLQWIADSALENINLLSSAIVLGAAAGFLLKRKPALASGLALAFVLQQAVLGRPGARLRMRGRQRRKDVELERYALKAQRGDYGKLEVIPFR